MFRNKYLFSYIALYDPQHAIAKNHARVESIVQAINCSGFVFFLSLSLCDELSLIETKHYSVSEDRLCISLYC